MKQAAGKVGIYSHLFAVKFTCKSPSAGRVTLKILIESEIEKQTRN